MDLFRFVTHVLRVALTLAQFVLVFFPDKEKSTVFMAGEVCECKRKIEKSLGVPVCEVCVEGRGECVCACARVCVCVCVVCACVL